MKKVLAYTIVTNPEDILYPPLLDDTLTDFIAIAKASFIKSNFWKVHIMNNLEDISEDLISTPETYFPGYSQYIFIHPEEIIYGRLSQDSSKVMNIPPIKNLLPSHIKPEEPTYQLTTSNPSYFNGPYDGYPLQLSICLPISNRADSLRKCLDGLKPLLDQLAAELIVVDSSTDGSTQIAEAYGAKIIPFIWTGNFSEARNAAIRQAQGSWILSIDDDEWLDDSKEIVDFFKSPDWKKYDLGLYKVRNYTDPERTDFSDISVERMAKNHPKLHYIHAVHETFDFSFLKHSPRSKYFSSLAHHIGYAYKNETDRENKVYRNLAGMYTSLKEAPFDLRLHYQLANELTILRKYNAAAAYCLKIQALSRLCNNSNIVRNTWSQSSLMFLYLIGHLSNDANLIDTAKSLTDFKSLNCFEKGTIYYVLAVQAFNTSDYNCAREYIKDYYSMRNEFMGRRDRSILSSHITVNLLEPEKRVNAIYIMHSYALLEGKKETEAATIFKKINLNQTTNMDLPILAKMLCSFNLNNFIKLKLSLSKDLLAEMYTYTKNQSNKSPMDQKENFSDLLDKLSNLIHDSNNIYLKLIEMHADPDNVTIYRELSKDPAVLRTHLDDIILCAAKHIFNLLEFLPSLNLEDIQQVIRCLTNLEKHELKQVLETNLDMDLTDLNIKETFFLSGLLESSLLSQKADICERDSEQYKKYFSLYIDLIYKWSLENYSTQMFSENNFDLLPATTRGVYYIMKALKAKELEQLQVFIDNLKLAVMECPLFNDGVKLLLTELENISEKKHTKPKTEFETLGEQLKDTAKQLIYAGNYDEARTILLQLSNLLPNDKEISFLLSNCIKL